LKPSRLPSTVIVLGLVSFFTDFSSEMIYPLLPVFLSTVLGAGAIALGVIEGVAEATASVLKIVSGYWTDKVGRRKPFILAGYGLASLVRPLIGLANIWPVVLGLRFADRVGKGLRTSPRDSLIADVVEPARRGEAYGFHRAMDHAGAVVGPVAAALLMSSLGVPIRTVFLLSAIPAVVVIAILLFGLKEKPYAARSVVEDKVKDHKSHTNFASDYKLYLISVGIFTLGNSTDAFLLLRMTDAGISAVSISLLWAAHHVIKMTSTYFGGRWSDELGYKPMIVIGWIIYAVIYLGFGIVGDKTLLIVLFLAYGLYFGLTEPAEKALVSRFAGVQSRGRAFGWFHGVIGIGALPASILFGILYKTFGAMVAFGLGAVLAIIAATMLSLLNLKTNNEPQTTL